MNKVIARRLDFLKLEAKGVSLPEIVQELSQKYRKSQRTIYFDSETRDTWQPVLTQLFDLEKARLVAINRYEALYREAAFRFEHSPDSQRPIWWSHMLSANEKIVALQGLETLREVQAKEAQPQRYSLQLVNPELDALT
jgi:hypothetical protein